VKGPIKTHNVGGLFGRHFGSRLGKELCRSANLILTKYNLPRYPGQGSLDPNEVGADIAFIEGMIKKHIREVVEGGVPDAE
jgi:hypothetical protein